MVKKTHQVDDRNLQVDDRRRTPGVRGLQVDDRRRTPGVRDLQADEDEILEAIVTVMDEEEEDSAGWRNRMIAAQAGAVRRRGHCPPAE